MNTAATTPSDPAALIAAGRRTIDIETRAVAGLAERIGPDFARACRLCLAATGRVVVTGLGKSGHVGSKIAATLASTGTPSFFLHAAEANHGDLGMISRGDVVIVVAGAFKAPCQARSNTDLMTTRRPVPT